MGYNDLIDRSDNAANVPEQVDTMLRNTLGYSSAALSIFPIVPMSSKQTRLPVLSTLPVAYFVNGDTGLKQTSKQAWTNKYLNAEELAVIVPIPTAVLDDSDFDIWANTLPHMRNAIARAIDDAIFFGTNKPSSWGTDIKTAAAAVSDAAHTYTRGTNAANAGGIAADFSNLFAKVETDGYDVDFVVANRTYKGHLRNSRDADGNHQMDVSPTEVFGVPVSYPMRGIFPTGSGAVSAFVGARDQGIIGLRQDFDYMLLDQAVITDSNGDVIYNLPQQDMVAMRITFRLAWEVANPINYDQPTAANRYPFATMLES